MIFDIIQLILALLLTGAILMQSSSAGLGAVFGGDAGVQRTKRGVEKKLHHTTIILAILFLGVALVNVLN
ncbi:preprotein translocase subunit SecG [Candidatus Uhrbacteria bacterium]|nr:preprotein translocase subunit SecG [Candidatus Uhrbacteria bacterium]